MMNNIRNNTADANVIVEAFYNEFVSQKDQELLNLAFAKKIEQSQLDEFLKDWDIERVGERKALMLSYVMKIHPYLEFSMYEKPRLEGLLKFYRFRNLQVISHYTKIVKALNQENIFPMILKGGAMKFIRPDLSRMMEDVDILVAEESEFLRSCEISKNLGYVFDGALTGHSIDLHLPNATAGTVDIHRYIYLENNYDKAFLKNLFARATKQKVFATTAFVPCFEDLLFLGMINLARNLHRNTSVHGILYSLFDFKFLIENKQDFNWDLVLENIINTNSFVQALLAMKFINKIVPNLLPESLLQNNIIEKEFKKYCDRVMFYRFYLHDLKMRCKKLKIKNALFSVKIMKNYLAEKPKYFLFKRINKNYFLTKIFLKMVGQNEENHVNAYNSRA